MKRLTKDVRMVDDMLTGTDSFLWKARFATIRLKMEEGFMEAGVEILKRINECYE